jgi:hypothetical protein
VFLDKSNARNGQSLNLNIDGSMKEETKDFFDMKNYLQGHGM